jgi:formate C-acetyltransferase
LIAFILKNARIDVDPRDFFADHFQGLGLLEKLREEKRKYIGSTKIPQTVETLRLAAASGYYNAELDLGHISPGWNRILKLGVAGILEEAMSKQDSLPEDHPSRIFYQSVIETYSAIRIYILRLSIQAQKTALLHPEYNCRMTQLSNALQNLANNAPSNFYEALQLSYIFHQLIEYEGEFVRSMGSFERNFGHFYEEDLRSGYLTRENAEELIRFFWMKFFAKTLGKNNGKNFYFGGLLPDGSDSYGELSKLALDCFYDMELTDPKLSIRFHKNTSDDQYRRIARCIRDGRTSMVLVNDEITIPAMMMRGKTLQDARNYLLIGCYEPAVEGEEIACNMSIKLNMAKSLELVLYNGVDPISKKMLGIKTGETNTLYSFDAFYAAYCSQLKHQVTQAMESIKNFEVYWDQINPSPLLAGTFAPCIASGKDVSQYGAKYNNTGCMGGGLANVADSLLVIKKLVYEENKLT